MHDKEHTGNIQLTIGDALPDFQLTLCISDTLDWRYAKTGNNMDMSPTYVTVSNHDLLGKHVHILFFNTSCKDCQRELPRIQKEYEVMRNDSTHAYLAISREENAEDIRSYWNANSLTLPYSAQTNRDIYERFATKGIPQLFVTDENGIIVEHRVE